jgi:short-subunit dehydrogenase
MKTCGVTGGANGIGRALALEFSRKGFRVFVIDNDMSGAVLTCEQISRAGGTAKFFCVDLARESSIEQFITELLREPQLDVFLHCAGVNATGAFEKQNLSQQVSVLEVNTTAPMHLTSRLLSENRIASRGTLVFIVSMSRFLGYPGASVYGASKDGLASYAQSLRMALRSRGMNVLSVFPGPTQTNHAKIYSPHNRMEHRRMKPERLAALVFSATASRKHHLIPGVSNKILALLGHFFPETSRKIMRRMFLKDTSS